MASLEGWGSAIELHPHRPRWERWGPASLQCCTAPAPTTIRLTGPAAHPPTDRPRSRTTVKSAVETLTPTRVRLTVEVPFDELKPSVDAAYRKMTKQVRIQGFRPGKVPPRIIDQRIDH